MGSASRSFYLAMLITTLFFNSQLMGATWDVRNNEKSSDGGTTSAPMGFLDDIREQVEKVSGEDKELITKIRVLLGFKASTLGGPKHGVELQVHRVSPAPVEAAMVEAPMRPFHHHIYSRSPPRKSRNQPVHGLDEGKPVRAQEIVITIAVSIGAAIIIFGAIMVLLCKKCRRYRRKRSDRAMQVSGRRSKVQISSSVTSKVSFDPDPGTGIYYFNPLSPVLETHSRVKQSSESKSMSLNGSILSSPLMGNVSCLDEEIHPIEPLSSDDESFHSVCNSDYLLGPTSLVSEEILSHPSANCSRSTSPNQGLIHNCLTKSHTPLTTSIPFQLKPPCCSSKGFEGNASESIHSSQPSSRSLFPLRAPQMHPSSSQNNEPCSKIQTKSLVQSPPKPPPPPPPLPPLKPPSFQKGCRTQQSSPVGKDGITLPKLKPLHWDKVRAAPDRSMVWDKIRSSSFELDEEMIESLFGYTIQSSAKKEEAKSKNSSPSKNLLDNKRLQNMTILLKALNATSEQVCDALMQGRGLSVQQLEALVRMEPTKEDEEKLSKFDGDISELVPTEQFVKGILKIPFAFSRIEAMLYKEAFEDEVVHLRKSFAMLEEACKELRSSRLFLKLLEAVLKTGNRMNVGTIRGGARAFKLDTLLKLADVKGTDGKTTLLHFVVQEMIRSEGATEKTKNKGEEREEDIGLMGLDLVSGLSTELSNAKKTASIDLDVLVTSVSNLSGGLRKLRNLMEVDLESDVGSFVINMKGFVEYGERTIEDLKEEENKVLLHVREITEYYHGDVGKDEGNPLRIFVVVRDFLTMLDRVCKEVRRLKIHQCAIPLIPFR